MLMHDGYDLDGVCSGDTVDQAVRERLEAAQAEVVVGDFAVTSGVREERVFRAVPLGEEASRESLLADLLPFGGFEAFFFSSV